MKLVLLVVSVFAFSAMAEKKTMKLKGVHCADCVQTLKEKICNDTYEKCEVKLISAKKEIGELKLVTKGKEKIDMEKISKIVEDEGYKIAK